MDAFSRRKRRYSEPEQRAPANGGSTSSRAWERMVRENEAELRDAVMSWRGGKGLIGFWNKGAERIFGFRIGSA